MIDGFNVWRDLGDCQTKEGAGAQLGLNFDRQVEQFDQSPYDRQAESNSVLAAPSWIVHLIVLIKYSWHVRCRDADAGVGNFDNDVITRTPGGYSRASL